MTMKIFLEDIFGEHSIVDFDDKINDIFMQIIIDIEIESKLLNIYRDALIVRKRYGILDYDNYGNRTCEDVGNDYSLSGERVRQIVAIFLRRLRHPSRSHLLIDYITFSNEINYELMERIRKYRLR